MSLTANFTKGTNGSNVQSSDAGDASAWDIISNSATCTITYDQSRALLGSGVSAVKLAQGGTPGTQGLNWVTSFGTQTDHYGRIYVWMDAYQSAANLVFVQAQSGASLAARIYITSSGALVVSDSTGSGLGTTSAVLRRGQWNRVEWHFIHSLTVGFVEAKLFLNPHSNVATETINTSNKNTLASVDRIQFFQQGGGLASGDTLWYGGILAQVQAYPGPITMGSQPGVLSAAGGILG